MPTQGKGGIYLVRHAKTRLNQGNGNTEDRIRGWINVPLSPEGRKEAEETAKGLVGLGIEKIVSSDLDRAVESAKAVSEALDVPISMKSREFRPWNLGDYQGKASKDVQPYIKHYAEKEPNKAVPGGESFTQFAHRLTQAMRKLMVEYKEGKIPTTAVITHYRDLKLIAAWVKAGSIEDKDFYKVFFTDDLGTGGIYRVYPSRFGWDVEIVSNGPKA